MQINDRIVIEWPLPGVAQVRLARPEKMNALDGAMIRALIDAAAHLHQEPSLRVVVLHGEGRAFCAGLDRGSLDRMARGEGFSVDTNGPTALQDRTHGIANVPQQAALGWRQIPVPVICALHGVALGGGLQVALGADIRLVAPETKLSLMEVDWGLVPDMAGMLLARGRVRADVFAELVYTARIVQGSEAVRLGLATRVCSDPLADALALAAAIAEKSPDAVRAAKRLLEVSEYADAAAVLQAESREQELLIGGLNQREAVVARLAGRVAQFVGIAS